MRISLIKYVLSAQALTLNLLHKPSVNHLELSGVPLSRYLLSQVSLKLHDSYKIKMFKCTTKSPAYLASKLLCRIDLVYFIRGCKTHTKLLLTNVQNVKLLPKWWRGGGTKKKKGE